jgi:long-chain acyl-CoA synthetase
MTLDFFEKFRDNAGRFPDRIAFQNISGAGRESFTYGQIAAGVRKISLLLARSGVRPADAVGIMMENHPRWGIAFLAAQSAGAVIVPLDILHDQETLAGLIEHAGCRFLMVSRKLVPAWLEIRERLREPLPFLVADEESEGGLESAAPLPLVERGLDDELMILYTSGTTGNPKGVVLTGRNVYRNVVEALKMVGPTPEDHFLQVLPLYHVLALVINFIIPLYLGARVTFLHVLEAQRIMQTFREEGISIFVCVPQFFYLVHRRILQEVARRGFFKRFLFWRLLWLSRFANLRLGLNPGRFFFAAIHRQFGPRLRFLGVGGARFDPQVAECFRDLGFSLIQAFGMSETAALITVALSKGRAVGTAGVPLPHVELRIEEADEEGIGEVLVRGENVFRGYHQNPEATAEALQDGWLRTGDLGCIDRRGFLHITGRKKDVIVLSSGQNIYPEEIEKFYQSGSPYIKEICVVGVPDAASGGSGEKLHAVVVPDFDYLKSVGVVSAGDTIRWEMETLSERLPPYKRVLSLEIRTDPLPLTTTRKIKRFQVQREVLERAARPAPAVADTPPETEVEERLFALIRAVKDAPAIGRRMNLELDLGFTSLERVELMSAIEEAFGGRIPEQEAPKIHTVAELAGAVERLRPGGEAPGEDPRTADEVLRRRPALELLLYILLGKVVRFAFRVLLRFRVEGVKNLPAPPCLICPNHASYLDSFLLMSALPYRVLRNAFLFADAEFFRGPVMSKVARWCRIVTVSPDRGVRLSLRLAAEGLRRGLVLCVFPEGERSIDGKLKVFRQGPAKLAAELGVRVTPVGIRGSWEVWHRGSNRIRLHPVSLRFGELLDPAGLSAEVFNGQLREAVERLL